MHLPPSHWSSECGCSLQTRAFIHIMRNALSCDITGVLQCKRGALTYH